MSTINKLPRAKADLAEIWEYIADDSEEQADIFIDAVDRKLLLLAEQPNIGRAREELAKNMRSLPIDRYVIFYVVLSYLMAFKLFEYYMVHEIYLQRLLLVYKL
jgi:toxin ParE1/3/4